jgi:hypothetical protein
VRTDKGADPVAVVLANPCARRNLASIAPVPARAAALLRALRKISDAIFFSNRHIVKSDFAKSEG